MKKHSFVMNLLNVLFSTQKEENSFTQSYFKCSSICLENCGQHVHSFFSAFILLLSSCPTFSLCSVYSCLMSSLAASIFRGFLDDWTFREGRTERLCCTMAEANLGGNEHSSVCMKMIREMMSCHQGFSLFDSPYLGPWEPKMASKSSLISIRVGTLGNSATRL